MGSVMGDLGLPSAWEDLKWWARRLLAVALLAVALWWLPHLLG